MISLKSLKAAAAELNKKLDLTPPIEDDLSVGSFIEEIKGTLNLIDPTQDKFSKETQAVLDELANDADETATGVEEEVEEIDEEDLPEDTLSDQVEQATKLADLKAIAKANDEFKSIRSKLNSFKTLEELQDQMLDLLEGKVTEPEDVEEEEVEEEEVKEVAERKPVVKDKPVKRGFPKTDGPKTKFGHAADSQAGKIDTALLNTPEGLTFDEIAKQCGCTKGRAKSHVMHLINKKKVKFEIEGDVYSLA